ncbi:2-hydroxymuconate tautomerase [Clostridium oceanicum]|uniref:Tautomerase n=1 Tax=Clostridium oceanicum TaxID=1543 RepID=A0ABP3UQ10_9CLOT
MPIVNVKISKGRSINQKKKLVKDITDVIVKDLDVYPEWVTVLIDEYDRENWASAGELHSEKFGSGFGKEGVK